MFERFTDKSIHVLMVGQKESRMSGADRLGTEEILLGLAQEKSGLTGYLLESAGFNLQRCRFELNKLKPRSTGVENDRWTDAALRVLQGMKPMPFTENSMRLIEHANAEAMRMRSSTVNPQHILLALAKLHDSVGYQLLTRSGVQIHMLQNKVLALLGTVPGTTSGDSNN